MISSIAEREMVLSYVSGRGEVIISVSFSATIGWTLCGVARVTSPAPALRQDMEVIAAAPPFPMEPAITST